jgi:hypothetical protein
MLTDYCEPFNEEDTVFIAVSSYPGPNMANVPKFSS